MAGSYKTAIGAARAVHRQMSGSGAYAGIAAAPEERLRQHRVDPRGRYVAVQCSHDGIARGAERILHQNGYRGASGGGSRQTRWVYAYEVTPYTCEKC